MQRPESRPWIYLLTVFSLALGIGSNTSIFRLLDALMPQVDPMAALTSDYDAR